MNQDSEHKSDQQANFDYIPSSSSSWRRKIFITVAIVLLGGGASGLVYGWYFVQRKLIPLVETEAGNYLHRPLELGELKAIAPTGASFGNSALPATNSNPDSVQVTKVKINLAPLYFLRWRKLKLDIILEKPTVYIEQDKSKLWTPTDFGSGDDSKEKIVEVQSIQLKGGKLALAAYNSPKNRLNPVVAANIDNITIRPQEGKIKFDAVASLIAGGKFTVDGQGNSQTGIIDLSVIAQQLNAREVGNLLALPIGLNQGDISGKIGVTLTNAPLPELRGALDLDHVALQVPNLVKAFSNSQGKISFAGSKVNLNNITTNFGEVEGVASGSLNLAEAGNYQINTRIKPIKAAKVIEALELKSPVPIKGKIKGNVKVQGTLDNPLVQLNIATVDASRIDKVDFQKINANLAIAGTTLTVKQFTALPKTGGKIAGNGNLRLDDSQYLAFNIVAQDVSGQAIARSYNNKLPVDIGLITGTTQIFAQGGDLSTLAFRDGQASFSLGNGLVDLNNLNYGQGIWTSQLKAKKVEFGSLPFGSGSAPAIAKGLITGVFDVSGTRELGDLNQLKAKGQADMITVGGKVALPKITIANGKWQADAQTKNLKLRRLFPDLPQELNDNLSGVFDLAGNIPDDAQPQTLINGVGDLALAKGKVKVEQLKIVEQNWTAIVQGINLRLKDLSSSTPDEFAGLVNGKLKLAGTTDKITPEGIKADGSGGLTLPEGVFAAEKLAIANGRFKASVTPQQVNLSLFADPNSDDLELNGQLGGKLEITGKVDNLSPTAVAAKGNLTFSQGIDLLAKPLEALIAWNGRRLDVLKAQGSGLNAQGHLELDESFFSDIPDKLAAVDNLEFDIPQAQGIDIKKLRLTLPSWANNLDYSGRSDFAGKISGTPAALTISGNLGLNNFRLEGIEFDPFLAGSIHIAPETGVDLKLNEILTTPLLTTPGLSSSENSDPVLQPLDKIELVLDRHFSPLVVAIANDDLGVKGTGKNEVLEFTTQNIPVKLLKTAAIKSEDLKVPDNLAIQPVSGKLSGDFVFNLNTLETSGKNVVIDDPALASIRGDRLQGNFQYKDGYVAIQDGKFKQRNSIYKLEGNLTQKSDDIAVNGQVSIDGGQIQDILVALQVFELTDLSRIFSDRQYSRAADLYFPPSPSGQGPLFNVGLKNAPIIDQLQLRSAIQGWLTDVEQQQKDALVPPIRDLQGIFDGKINVSGSINTGLSSDFEFLGNQWQWGSLTSKKIITKGNLRGGILTLLPISIQLQDSTAKKKDKSDNPSLPTLLFTGTFGGETQSGQFKLVEVPVKLIEQLFSLPPELGLNGLINASASIAGTPEEPQARGEIRVDDAALNETSIQSTKGSFNYQNARLNFSASSVVAEDADPLVIKGNIPYKLPFSQSIPESDRLELQLNVKDKGMALLDIFTGGELKWIDGRGEIVLDISGILDAEQNIPRKLVAEGTATIENATVAAKSIPKNPITNINSQVFFDLDNIRVNSFAGDFGGGEILAAGTVPLSQDVSSNPLAIAFDDIKIDLPKFYNGGVKGKLQILGKATEPNITGEITLFDGTIFLDDEASKETKNVENISNKDQKLNAISRRKADNEGIAAVTQYKNLQLQLGEDIQISQPPIFTFLATGNLNVNGTFLQPNPNGTINLKRGQVNLFTTQLNLSRDYQNTARFTSNNVLDPFLDVLLIGSALETTERKIPSEVLPTEIPDAFNVGTLETVRISAKVKGLASQITNKIELSSSPPRSQTEIAALLGGGVVEALGNSNGTLGLATLAGSALFGSLNGEFNNIFPLGELRLFPTQIIDEDRDNDRNDGLAGELAFDLIDNFSFSVLKILNTDIPAQYGFRYRFNNNFVLRGSSDFQSEGSRALIEFESRF